MRIVVPFTSQYHPLARLSHDGIGGVERCDVSGSDDAYHRLLAVLWATAQDFLVVEHDIEVTESALAEARVCLCEWAVSPYGTTGGVLLDHSLGCTRFRRSLMLREADLFAAIDALNDDMYIPHGDWRMLDARLYGMLLNRGYTPHLHSSVLHHHVDSGVCACGTEHAAYPVDHFGRYVVGG